LGDKKNRQTTRFAGQIQIRHKIRCDHAI